MFDTIIQYMADSGFGQFHWSNGVMLLVGLLFIWLAIRKGFEPLLLVPIGFGILIGNIPYDASKLPLSVYDGPVSDHDIAYYEFQPGLVINADGTANPIEGTSWAGATEGEKLAVVGREVVIGRTISAPTHHEELMRLIYSSYAVLPAHVEYIDKAPALRLYEQPHEGQIDLHSGVAVMVNKHSLLDGRRQPIRVYRDAMPSLMHVPAPEAEGDEPAPPGVQPPQILSYGQGRYLYVENPAVKEARALKAYLAEERARAADPSALDEAALVKAFKEHWRDDGKSMELWSLKKQDPWSASVFWWLFAGVGLAGFYPPLIFLGIGALTDFGPMLSNPKTLLLGAAAQFGIFGALLAALMIFGFNMAEAASIGIIGGADGPTAIFTCSQLAPHLLGAVALAAYSYMAMVPIIQPPIIKLLTTKQERLIRMEQSKPVPRPVKIMFPVIGFLLTALICPGGLPLLGMLFFGNLLRESMVTERLAKTAQTTFIDIVTILLGVTVGAKTSAPNFLTWQTIFIFVLGIGAFGVATAAGVIFGKIMNWLSPKPINPMIGAAGVSAVPMAARVVHKMGQDEDPQNFLIMHAMGPNVAGVIGSAVAAGVLLSAVAK